MLKEKQRVILLPRTIELVLGTFIAIVSLALFTLCIALVISAGVPHIFNDPMAITILGIPTSFGAFFSVIALNMLLKRSAPKRELMSIYGWRRLAFFMFTLATIVIILGYWPGSILPIILGSLCLLKNPTVRKMFVTLSLKT